MKNRIQPQGWVAEWLCRGLQILERRFDSDPSLHIYSNVKKESCPGGGIGRHKGLKIPRRKLRAGSSPASGTILCFT